MVSGRLLIRVILLATRMCWRGAGAREAPPAPTTDEPRADGRALTGLVLHDAGTGADHVFELFARDARAPIRAVRVFCQELSEVAQEPCEHTIRQHLTATVPSLSALITVSSEPLDGLRRGFRTRSFAPAIAELCAAVGVLAAPALATAAVALLALCTAAPEHECTSQDAARALQLSLRASPMLTLGNALAAPRQASPTTALLSELGTDLGIHGSRTLDRIRRASDAMGAPRIRFRSPRPDEPVDRTVGSELTVTFEFSVP